MRRLASRPRPRRAHGGRASRRGPRTSARGSRRAAACSASARPSAPPHRAASASTASIRPRIASRRVTGDRGRRGRREPLRAARPPRRSGGSRRPSAAGSPAGTSRPFSPSVTTSATPPTSRRDHRRADGERLDDRVREVLPATRRGATRRPRGTARARRSRGSGPRNRTRSPSSSSRRALHLVELGAVARDQQRHVARLGHRLERDSRAPSGARFARRTRAAGR